MSLEISIPNSPERRKEDVSIKVDPVQRSIARPDAFAKPATIGKHSFNTKVRVRLTNQRPPGRPKRKKRDPRDVKFW